MAMIRVLVADDDALVRTAIGLIIGGTTDIEVVGESDDGTLVPEMVDRLRPDVVLLDIRMPQRDGLWAARKILTRPDPPAVLMLTTFDTPGLVLDALAAGAQGFLLKNTPPARMVSAIRAVAAGEPTLSPEITAQVIQAATRGVDDPRRDAAAKAVARLSERELEVARAIGQGKSNAEIAGELYMSVATVKAYVTRILTKLQAANRVQIALLVHDAGLSWARPGPGAVHNP